MNKLFLDFAYPYDNSQDALGYWQALSPSAKERMRELFYEYANKQIKDLEQAISEVESVVIP